MAVWCPGKSMKVSYTQIVLLTKKVRKWVSATKEFPEDIVRITECEWLVEMLSIVEMAP